MGAKPVGSSTVSLARQLVAWCCSARRRGREAAGDGCILERFCPQKWPSSIDTQKKNGSEEIVQVSSKQNKVRKSEFMWQCEV